MLASIFYTSSKRLLFLYTVHMVLFSSITFGLVEGKYGKIGLGANNSLSYDSNIFSSELNESDIVQKTTPSITYSKKLGIVVATASAGIAVTRYLDHPDQDAYDPQTNFDLDLSGLSDRIGFMKSGGGKLKFDVFFDVGQNTSTNVIEQDIVSTTNYDAGFDIRYDYSPKFGLGSKLSYGFSMSDGNASYSDLSNWSLTGRAFYIYSQKLEFYSDYEYEPISGSGGQTNFIDSATHGYKVGMSGNVFTKIKGDLYIGYSFKEFDSSSISSDSAITFGGALTWKMNPKRSLRLSLNRGFSASAQNQSLLTTNLALALNHRFDNKTSGLISANYSTTEYTGSDSRESKTMGLGASLTRNFNANILVGLNYDYSKTINDSSEDFDRHLATLDFNVNY